MDGNCSESLVIDRVPINILIIGTVISATYNGTAGIVQVTATTEVRCATDFFGPDCITRCSSFESCANCGLPELTGQYCQFSVDTCTDVYCNGNGNCEDGSFNCHCHSGFVGQFCETNIDGCAGVNCNNGQCIDERLDFRCECDPGFIGDRCETNVDDCVGAKCSNGTCVDEVDSFRCECDPGFTGGDCEIDIDFCEEANCNNGVCMEENLGFRCKCNPGFTGDHCQGTV